MHDEANRRLQGDAELEATAETRFASALVIQTLTLLGRAIAWLRRKPQPTSARATLAARRQRDQVPDLKRGESKPGPFDVGGVDPDTLDAQGLVRWFGAELHD